MKSLLITIDGPAGAGKTTVSRMLAQRLGYRYIDTGALYRGIAFQANAAGIQPDDDAGLTQLCRNLKLELKLTEAGIRLTANGADITDFIRTPEISMLASAVSTKPVVRNFLSVVQKDLGKEKCAVFEGRDMGTVVFPDADVKFFLDASLEIRAQRRLRELGSQSSPEAVLSDMKRRDENDRSRPLAPLKPADDAIIIDSTGLTPDEVVERMLSVIKRL